MSEVNTGVSDSLKPLIARLRSLQSAWSALAPSGVAIAGQSVAESGRVLGDELARLASSGVEPDEATLSGLQGQLTDLDRMIGEIAQTVSPAQLRSTLPQRVGPERRRVLELLDLLIDQAVAQPDKISARLGSIDYLVTLLCTGGEGGGIRHDPVTLTPRMNALCNEIKEKNEPIVSEIEAEFFAASNLEGERVQEEITLRHLRSRKSELGLLYFAPRILRAVVTYNATLAERLADELWASQDWGSAVEEVVSAAVPAATQESESGSVFDSEALRRLAAALRRRAADGVPDANELDRVAWCLDLDYAEGLERKSLLRADAGSRENLIGTTVLVGLINRSSAAISVELQAIGIPPEVISGRWMPELSEVLKTESNSLLLKDAYAQACVLSELKNKFLLSKAVNAPRQRGVETVQPSAIPAPSQSTAREASRAPKRDIVRDALEEHKDSTRSRPAKRPAKSTKPTESQKGWIGTIPWRQVAPMAAALALVVYLAVHALGGRDLDPSLNRFGAEELASVSPHLAKGYRNGEGYGPAFVGTLDSAWLELSLDVREEAAAELVEKLRSLGIRQVMIYDRNDQLRIQAVGEQAIRTL